MNRCVRFVIVSILAALILSACTESAHEVLEAVHTAGDESAHATPEFGGKIARSYAESE